MHRFSPRHTALRPTMASNSRVFYPHGGAAVTPFFAHRLPQRDPDPYIAKTHVVHQNQCSPYLALSVLGVLCCQKDHTNNISTRCFVSVSARRSVRLIFDTPTDRCSCMRHCSVLMRLFPVFELHVRRSFVPPLVLSRHFRTYHMVRVSLI